MTRKCSLPAPLGACLVFLTALLLLGGCATTPPPTGLMNQATTAADAARAAGAGDYAPLELGFAVKKLDLAQSAMAQEDYALAARLAQESQANSTLARTKAQLAKLRDKIKTQSAENARLRSGLDDGGMDFDASHGGAA